MRCLSGSEANASKMVRSHDESKLTGDELTRSDHGLGTRRSEGMDRNGGQTLKIYGTFVCVFFVGGDHYVHLG